MHPIIRPPAPRPALLPVRAMAGRPGRLALRTLAALAAAGTAVHVGAGPAPATGALAGIITSYLLTARADLAPPPDGMP